MVPAVILDAKDGDGAEAIPDERAEARSAKECLQHFHANASATAFELALALAAAPLTLPVMRLVQQAVLPHSRQVHLAEVFLGGLLKRVSPDEDNHDPEATEYDFLPGVRDLLLDAALVPDSIQVLGVVSNYLESRFGQALDFLALLEYPTDSGGMVLGERNLAFATVAAKVLRRLGGRYAQIAQVIDRSVGSASELPSNVNASPPVHERAAAQHDISVPHGLKLLHTLRAQTKPIGRMGWSKDGRWLATLQQTRLFVCGTPKPALSTEPFAATQAE